MHLSEILVFQGIRNWFSQSSKNTSLLKAISDERMVRVVNAVQKEPQKKWTTQNMAQVAGMSRSAFSQRFVRLFGLNPSKFVRNIKLDLPEAYFRDEGVSIGEAAHRLGYESEAAFARAYKRFKGLSPGTIKGKSISDR
jgi:AraC-like DNA-binding protein